MVRIILLAVASVFGCHLLDSPDPDVVNKSYTSLLAEVGIQTQTMQQAYRQATSGDKARLEQQANDYLFGLLTDSGGVFHHWMGTEWDYNGITTEPLKGEIACGYFVTTPLKQLGFNLNRYKIAQQYSHSIANTLCAKGSVKSYNDLDIVLERINAKKNSLYVVGLDNHVGFLVNIKGEVFFIHSDYITDGVVKESPKASIALLSSNLYVVGNLLGNNPELVKKWLKGEFINIIP